MEQTTMKSEISTTATSTIVAKEMTLEQASIPTTITLRGDGSTTESCPKSTVHAARILLDPNEAQLFRILVEAANAFTKGDVDLEEWQLQPETRPSTVVIRVAGGWVRDKLIQDYGGGYDVDLAIQHMSGVQCAKIIQQYVQKYHPDVPASRMGVIAANPDQSKHLETATFKLCGIEMDLSTLRSHEVYADDSRIPIVRLGTPLEDSLRRDITVNALFYNLHSQQVEDWTGRGLRDLLQERLLVTPVEPVQTFRDDPLRILRAIRFAVRLNLRMDPSLTAAARLPEIRQALRIKVSRERIGKELEGMLSGKQAKPVVALQTIIDLGLASIVFGIPQPSTDDTVAHVQGELMGQSYSADTEECQLVEDAWKESRVLLSTADALMIPLASFIKETQPRHMLNARLLPLAVLLSPLRHIHYVERKKPDRIHSVVGYIVRSSIKFKKDDVTAMTLLADHVDTMQCLLQKGPEHINRLEAGLLLRALQELWPTALVLAAIIKARHDEDPESRNSSVACPIPAQQLYMKIFIDFGLDECWKTKPFLDGKALQKHFGKGPIIGAYMQEQIRWMLANPCGTAESCLAYLKDYTPDPPLEGPRSKKPHIET